MKEQERQKIVPIEPQDVPIVLKIVQKEFPYRRFETEQFHERVLQPSVFVFKAVNRNELAGFVDLEFLDEQTGRITALGVLEKFWGKKIGKKLVDFAIDFFRKQACKKIVLLVAKENKTAKKIYEQAGFKKTKELEKIGGKEAEEMELQIAQETD